jgi:hypothetical protein
MSVEVRYHVIREGKEIAVYTSKKEADAHDKMLDIAEELVGFISQADSINIEDETLEELCIYLSKNRDNVVRLLKGGKLPPKTAKEPAETAGLPKTSKSEEVKKKSAKSDSSKSPKPLASKMEKAASAQGKNRRKTAGTRR